VPSLGPPPCPRRARQLCKTIAICNPISGSARQSRLLRAISVPPAYTAPQ
jgi:hypothetical protein